MSTVRYHSYVHVYVHVHAHVMHEYLECFPFTGCTDFQIWSCVRACVCVKPSTDVLLGLTADVPLPPHVRIVRQ